MIKLAYNILGYLITKTLHKYYSALGHVRVEIRVMICILVFIRFSLYELLYCQILTIYLKLKELL